MIEAPKHKIRSQEYEITLDNEKEAHHYQSTISLLQDTRIVKLLDRIMNEVEDPNSIYQFNTIDLDLGSIQKENFENEVIYRLEEKLLLFFHSNIQENGSLKTGKRIELSDQKLVQFKHFLDYGYLNRDINLAHSPTELLQELIQEDKDGFRKLLMNLGRKESARKRMILQFDETPLESIVKLVSKEESDHIITYKRNILDLQQKQPIADNSFSSFRNAIWEIILAYLFTDSQSFYSKKNFLFYLINKIAVKYNLEYKTLLQLISTSVQGEKKLGGKPDFKKIIFELEKEQQKKNPKVPSRKVSNEIIYSEFLKMLDVFFTKGVFSNKYPTLSRQEINQQFFLMLQSKDTLATEYISRWLANEPSKIQLLKLLNPSTIQKLTVAFNVPFVINSLRLFSELNQYSSKATFNWDLLFKKRHELTIRAYLGKSQNLTQNISNLFSYISKQLITQRDELILFLQNIENELPVNFKKGVSQYLKSVETESKLINDNQENKNKQIKKDQQWNKVLTSLIQYTNEHEIETWNIWLDDQLPAWLKFTEMQTAEFLQRVLESFKHDLSKVVLSSFIESQYATILRSSKPHLTVVGEKNGNYSIYNALIIKELLLEIEQISNQQMLSISWNKEIITLLKRISKKYDLDKIEILQELIKLSSSKGKGRIKKQLDLLADSTEFTLQTALEKKQNQFSIKKEMILFILSKGTYPWWIEQYSAQQFNTDFTQLWKNASFQKKALQIIVEQGTKNDLGELLSSENQTLIWKESYQKEPLSHFILNSKSNLDSPFAKLYVLFESKLFSLNIIQMSELTQLRKQVFKLLLQQKKPEVSDLLQLLKNWIENIPALQNQILLEQITNILLSSTGHSEVVEKQIKSLFPIETKNESAEVMTSLKDFVVSYFRNKQDYKIAVQSIAQQLQHILNHDVEQIKQWLTITQFRKTILKELEFEDALKVVRHCLPPQQQSYFQESISLLSRINFLSKQIIKKINTQFIQLLLLKISLGGISQWNQEQWGKFIFHLLIKTVGGKKTSEILLVLNEENEAQKSDKQNLDIKIFNHINSLATQIKDPLKIKKPNPELLATLPKSEEEDKAYKKLGEEESKELSDPIFIDNGGLIILAPFLGMLFEKCRLTRGNAWVNDEAHHKAAHLLQYAAHGESEKADPGWIINKVLCGIPISFPIDQNITLSEEDKEIVDSLLFTITQQWTALKGTSIDGLRTSFLQRASKIEEEEEQFYMMVEKQSYDMLLDQIPWNITKIKLSWMLKLLQVQWRV